MHSWTLGFADGAGAERYQADMAARIQDTRSISCRAAGLTGDHQSRSCRRRLISTPATKALLLEYEEALCGMDSTSGKWLAGSGHMIWIGDRTRQPDGAHVDFCKGVLNPIGLKCGPSMETDDLKRLMADAEPGK